MMSLVNYVQLSLRFFHRYQSRIFQSKKFPGWIRLYPLSLLTWLLVQILCIDYIPVEQWCIGWKDAPVEIGVDKNHGSVNLLPFDRFKHIGSNMRVKIIGGVVVNNSR